MEYMRLIRSLGLLVLLSVTGLWSGCGQTALSPTEQDTVNATIKKKTAERHKELNAELKTAKQSQGNIQKKRAGTEGPRMAHREDRNRSPATQRDSPLDRGIQSRIVTVGHGQGPRKAARFTLSLSFL